MTLVRLASALLASSQLLAACTMWVPTTTPVPALLSVRHPSRIRLRLQDSSHVQVTWPSLVGDSLIRSDSVAGPGVALRDVTAVQVREFSVVKTVTLSVVISMVTFGLFCALDGGCYAD